MEEKTIGPSYKQISGKYTDSKENYKQLITKVKAGGSGVWGNVPMSPHPDLSDKEIQTMLSYVVAFAGTGSKNYQFPDNWLPFQVACS